MKIGLVSVTYRKLTPTEIIDACRQAGLNAIEWGGDVHVPHGDLTTAREVGTKTRDAGLTVSSYGSYYRLNPDPAQNGPAFEQVLETAVALDAPTIRLWAGNRSPKDADAAYRQAVVDDAKRIAALAKQAGRTISYEFHGNTLTETTPSARELFRATEDPAIYSLWQPPNGETLDACIESLQATLPRLSNVHVFHWWPDASVRNPLVQGTNRWLEYLAIIKNAGKNPDLLLEFVPNDDPSILVREADTLRSWIA
jgi:3-dehydroshikimate dehydratase